MEERVYEILEKINKKIIQYEGDNMLEDEIVESMEIMDIVVQLEEELGIEIGPEFILPEYFMSKESIVKLVTDVREGK